MAAKPAEKETPPIYEISPTRIFIYLAINFAVGGAASGLSHFIKDSFPVFCYFFNLFLLTLFFYVIYFSLQEYDIPAQIYHPDLIPQKEYKALYKRFIEVEHNRLFWDYLGKPFPRTLQEEYDYLKSIIAPQNELRAVCFFKKLIGVQQCSTGKKIEDATNRSTKSSAINDKIPSYEISPKWILIYLSVNFIIVATAAVLFFLIKNPLPLLIYSFIYLTTFFLFLMEYDRKEFYDISSLISHPDLMPEKEFVNLKKRFEEIAEIKRNYYHANQSFPEKYQQGYDTLKPIFDAQSHLRGVCWFKKLIGVPKFVVHENPTEIMAEDSNAEAFDEPESDSSDSSFDGIDLSAITDNKSENNKAMNTMKAKAESDDIAHMKSDMENLKARLAAVEAKNSKLENFIETFIESQAIV